MPSAARPVATSCRAMLVTVSLGMAKPIPTAAPPICGSLAARVGMPMTCPDRLTSAPPLFPGLIGALVWMALMSTAELPWPSDTVRPVADTIPSVTVPVNPSGLPMASTISPTRTALDFPKVACRNVPAAPRTRITARSSGANTPRTAAANVLLPLGSLTRTSLAEPTTCALVTISPSASKTTPEPSPSGVVICTTEGSTVATTRSYSRCSVTGPPVVGALRAGLALLAALLAAPPPPPQAVTPAAMASASPMLARPGHPISRLQSVMARTHHQQDQPAAHAGLPSVAGRYLRAPATTSLIQDQARPPGQ